MESLMRYINRTSRLSALYRSERLEKYGLSGMHHSYILHICRNPGVSQEKLAKLIYVNKSNVARQVASLESNGYVSRAPSPYDGREMLVYPTDKAHKVYPIIVDILKEWNTAIMEDFSEEEQAELVRAMEKIMHKAKNVLDDLPEKRQQKQ